MNTPTKDQDLIAADEMDWQQVALNGGPPCFHVCDDGKFCGRAERWDGHDEIHHFRSLVDLIKGTKAMTEKINSGSIALIRRFDGVLEETMVSEASKSWISTGAGTFNRRTMRRLYNDDPIVFIGDQLGARKFIAESK